MFCLYSSLFCSKFGSCRYSSNALTRETGACFTESVMFTQPLTPMTFSVMNSDDKTHVFEVGHGNVEHVLQPPCGIQVVDHLVVLLDKRLVDRQRFLSVRLDHLKVMFYTCPAKMKVSTTFPVSISFVRAERWGDEQG